MKRTGLILGTLLPLLMLAGCGGEPSEAQMRDAVQGQFDQVNSAAAEVGRLIGRREGFKAMGEIRSFKKHQCKAKPDSNGYVCSFSIIADTLMGEIQQTGEKTFLKTDKGWVVQ
ncbi:hypothetical protein [Niveispirillum fermenti]|uniref:hypothetical protein n=1 Tax=Niveispirillum fermenti TaxID=1233113 RepID=UPI003A8AAD9A